MIAFKRSQKLGTCLGVSLVIGKKLRDGQLKIVRKSHVAIPFLSGQFCSVYFEFFGPFLGRALCVLDFGRRFQLRNGFWMLADGLMSNC